MTALRLIDVLPDFGAPAAPARDPEPQRPKAAHVLAPPPAEPKPTIGEIVRAEVARAEEALTMRLSVDHEVALLEQRQRHAEEIEALARRYGEEAGERIAARLVEVEREVGDHVAAAVARVLGGVLTEDLRKRSLQSLAASIKAAVEDAESMRIEVRGPLSLFASLSALLADRGVNLYHIEAHGFDLSVVIDGTVFETRLSEWSTVLSEILA